MRSFARCPLLASLLVAGAGCPNIPSSYPAAPRVELGSTPGDFTPLVDGNAVQIVHGIQGGFHIWGAVRAQYVDPRSLQMHFTIALDDGTPPIATRDDAGDLDGTSDGLTPGTHVATTVFLTDPTVVRGRATRFTVTVTDQEGRTGSDSHRVFPTGNP
jgi:hypothetical protein